MHAFYLKLEKRNLQSIQVSFMKKYFQGYKINKLLENLLWILS